MDSPAERTDWSRARTLQTAAERAAFDAATSFARDRALEDPPESAYLELLAPARTHVLRVFASSVLAESAGWLPEPFTVTGTDRTPPGGAGVGPWVADALASLPAAPTDVEFAVLPFPDAETVIVTSVLAGPAYRPQAVGDVYVCTPDGWRTLSTPTALIEALVDADGVTNGGDRVDRFARKLETGVANLALAFLASRAFPRLDAAASLLHAVPAHIDGADPAATFERLASIEESTTSAVAKYRSLSPAAALNYAAEFTPAVDVRFVAVADEYATRTSTDGADSISHRLRGIFDGLGPAVEATVPEGADPDAFTLLPVHPWQFHHALPDRFAREIADGVVVPLDYHTPATPLANLRTVVPFADDAPHLKLTLSAQKSSTMRHLRPASVSNGPEISDVLRAIEPEFDRLGFLAEEAAACYHPWDVPVVDGDDYDAACSLSALVRTNPHAHPLADGRHPIMAGSLLASVPGRDGPLAIELLSAFADARDESVEAATVPFFEAYLDAVLPELLRLATAYGVGLEHHTQNCVVLFDDDARPVASLARDFGGIRLVADRLAARGHRVNLYPNSDPEAESPDEVYYKLSSSFFKKHLGELIGLFAAHTALTSEECWRRTAARTRAVFEGLRRDEAVPRSWVDADEKALFAERVPYRASTRIVLDDLQHESLVTTVVNPLAAVE